MIGRQSLASVLGLVVGWLSGGLVGAQEPGVVEQPPVVDQVLLTDEPSVYRTATIKGRVVFLAAALRQQFGITTVPEVSENSLAILTEEGTVVPLVENLRGRAFRKDSRLRDTELELVVRLYKKHPLAQIIGIYESVGKERREIDYWCDICAIVMYEWGPCACCQEDNRMRKRLVVDGETISQEIEVPPLELPKKKQ